VPQHHFPGKASDRRSVRPTLRDSLPGLEIGTSRATLPVVAGALLRTPHIALSGAYLALRAPDCNGWPRRWVPREDGAIGAPEEPAGFQRKLRAWSVLCYLICSGMMAEYWAQSVGIREISDSAGSQAAGNRKVFLPTIRVTTVLKTYEEPLPQSARGGSASSGIQALGCRDRRGGCQSKGCSTAWRMRPNHQCARFNCRARDRGGPLQGSFSKPSCNCPLGMRNLFFEIPTQRMGHLTEQRPVRTRATVRQATDIFPYAPAFLLMK
jgi:hypothetical protein